MIPSEVADIADLIARGWRQMDEEASNEVLKAAWRIWNEGYRLPPTLD